MSGCSVKQGGWTSQRQDQKDFPVSVLPTRAGKGKGETFRTRVWPFRGRLLVVSSSLSGLGYTWAHARKNTDTHTPRKALNQPESKSGDACSCSHRPVRACAEGLPAWGWGWGCFKEGLSSSRMDLLRGTMLFFRFM